jgi:spore germination protein YaaH/flagellar hook assembly protein FlgD
VTRPISARRLSRSIPAAALMAALAAGSLPWSNLAGGPPVDHASDITAAVSSGGATDATDEPAVDAAAATRGSDVLGPDAEPPATAATAVDRPSTAYEAWLAHANDRISFTPGGRVTIGFTPRSTDAWTVGGLAPSGLPAGRLAGMTMGGSNQGSLDVVGSGSGSTDPVTTGSSLVDAPARRDAGPATLLSATVPGPSPAAPTTAARGLRREVFGFLPYWQLAGAARRLDYSVLTTIAYFSVGADAAGNLIRRNGDGTLTTGWAGWSSSAMTAVINAAHAHRTRVVLTASLFAWTTSGAAVQQSLLGSAAARLNLARQLAAAVRDRGADGVNLDVEPLVAGQEADFVALVKTLRSQLNAIRHGYQLTFDATGKIGNYPLEASLGTSAADAVFVMGYDYRTAGAAVSGSIDPLSGPGYDLTDTIIEYTSRIDPSRVILGVPWYGRAWSTATSAPRSANVSGTEYGSSVAVDYASIPALVNKYGRKWDAVEQSPYIAYRRTRCTTKYGCVVGWRQVWYDDAASLARRYQLVNDYGLRGAGTWALGFEGDSKDMVTALSNAFLVDHAAPRAGIVLLPAKALDEGIVVTWSANDVSGVRLYDVQVAVDGGAWKPWITGTRETSDVWLGADGHAYAFRVRASDTKGNVGSWNVSSTASVAPPSLAAGGFGRVTLDGLAVRSGPSTSATLLGTLSAGTVVALMSGPVSANGSTWFEVTQPIAEWAPVSLVERGVWIAVRTSSAVNVVPFHAPNATVVDAGISNFDFGAGGLTGSSQAAVAGRTFSPNGDGSRDGLAIRWTASVPMDSLTLNVLRLDGTFLGSVTVPTLTTGTHTWTWDGTAGGKRVLDGRYVLQLVGTRKAVTYDAPSAMPTTPPQIAAFGVTVDTVPPTIGSSTASASLISPNGDGIRDTVAYALASRGGVSWWVRIASAGASPVRTVSGAGRSLRYVWDGRDDHGAIVPDGVYAATLAACDVAGNCATRTYPIRVDTTPPTVADNAAPGLFSPNGDGSADTVRLTWTSSEAVTGTIAVWHGSTLVRRWTLAKGTAGAVTWNGRNAAGSAVADGQYAVKLDVRDAAGNRALAVTHVAVDRTAGFLRWSGNFYPQDGDNLAASSTVSWRLTRTATTTLAIYDAAGTLVRTIWTGRVQAAGTRSWTWNGRLASGAYAPDGRYVARLTVTSPHGTQTLQRSVWATAFPATLSPAVVRAGQVLTVRFVSAEPLRSTPKVTLRQPGIAPVTVAATRLANGSYVARLIVSAGAPGTATIRILATDALGRSDTSVYVLAVAS